MEDKYNNSKRQIDDYEVFYDDLWTEYISEKVVSTKYIEENRQFIDNITFDMFSLYIKSNSLSMSVLGKMVESFFFNLFRFKGSNENSPYDVLENY